MENNIKAPTKGESQVIKFMILLGIFSVLNFLFYFFQPEHAGDPFIFFLLTITILYSILKKLYMWYNYSNISIPAPPERKTKFSVDILTTYFPGEPYQMTVTTLEAINNITYPHTTYLCDEANDPYLRNFCEENGIIHVTRNNLIDAKAGNINNALKKFAKGDICVVLDPDHIPEPNFLDPILPYFEDPEIGFVQIVQSYYNIKETLVSRGAAEQTYQFYGPMMMTLNSYGAVNAIGANCVFRRSALDSIGGHAPGLCEDMHTAMLLYSKGWKAVYLPEVLARGLAPSNLTNFFKQQLKWSRGTFDLLLKVYPRIFNKLTGRQKIHYGILPLHYLGGLIIFINFLIPIISLVFSITPWAGNILDFVYVILPVAASSILIRTYIQKWVIEKKERGFHIVGGLLHINTWWIYILGFVYTIVDKKVPYLPTPKEDEWNTNLKIILPNAAIAVISIFAIVYGLSKDLTPFSIIMAFFAFFNACIMLFGIYLTFRVTNQNQILKRNLGKLEISFLWKLKQQLIKFANVSFHATRKIALPLLLGILILSMSSKQKNDLSKWEQVEISHFQKKNTRLLGIYHPTTENGLSDVEEIDLIANRQNVNFDIISFYLAWDNKLEGFPQELIAATYERNALPMITWEPWTSNMVVQDTLLPPENEQKVFKQITDGVFDDYLREFAQTLKKYNQPVFLRFGHEFDNLNYPWSPAGGNTPEEFINAWKHLYHIVKNENANRVMFVWNPHKAHAMQNYYPGDEFVDWIGFTLLNYGPLNTDGVYYPFRELYEPFRREYFSLTRKPVMLAEFGSLKLGNRQQEWLRDAASTLDTTFEEISAIVMFNSKLDKNVPSNNWYTEKYIDWTTSSIEMIEERFAPEPGIPSITLNSPINRPVGTYPLTYHEVRGVTYKKGTDWRNNYYTLTKNEIVEDFKLMKEAGINTIHFTGGNIYDRNVLKYSEEFNLQIIYEFNIENSIDFINDKTTLRDLRKQIIGEIEKFKSQENIIGYTFNYDLERYYEKPLLFYQQIGYLNWMNSLVNEIKFIEKEKSLNIDLPLNEETISSIKWLSSYLPIDSYGLKVKDTAHLREVLNFSDSANLSVFISDLYPRMISQEFLKLEDQDLILHNWQDERKGNSLTFDGLLDFKGRKKEKFIEVKNVWSNAGDLAMNKAKVSIIKPAIPLFPGRKYTYTATLLKENRWRVISKDEVYNFEWNLIKKDKYGNLLALKELGKGPSIEVEIPQEYKNYELQIIAIDTRDGVVTSARTTLHTLAPP